MHKCQPLVSKCIDLVVTEIMVPTPTRSSTAIHIDYICNSVSICCVPESIFINYGLCRCAYNKDHRPLQASFVLCEMKGSSPVRRRVVNYDISKIEDPVLSDLCVDKLCRIDPIGVEIENTSHCFLIEASMLDVLTECFPRSSRVKAREYISHDTFKYICEGYRLARVFHKCERRFVNSCLFVVFGIWADMHWRVKWNIVWGMYSRQNHVRWHQLKLQVSANKKSVKGMLKLERLTWIDAKADESLHAFEKSDIVGMHKSVGELIGHSKKKVACTKINRVLNDAGEVTQTYEEERFAFREHFSKLMCAKVMPLSEVIDASRIDQCDRYEGINLEHAWKAIPSPTDVHHMNLSAKKDKAPGENLLVGRVHSNPKFSEVISRIQYPLVLKSFVRVQPSIQWRGGDVARDFQE